MADKGVPLTGSAAYDEELYGGSAGVTGYAAVAQDIEEEEDVDERERAVARSGGTPSALHVQPLQPCSVACGRWARRPA